MDNVFVENVNHALLQSLADKFNFSVQNSIYSYIPDKKKLHDSHLEHYIVVDSS